MLPGWGASHLRSQAQLLGGRSTAPLSGPQERPAFSGFGALPVFGAVDAGGPRRLEPSPLPASLQVRPAATEPEVLRPVMGQRIPPADAEAAPDDPGAAT